ncbi:MAG: DsrE family protein [Nitrospirae bacterium]|nr:DsrE family protein [Nitrospirota bacterium]
MSRYTTVVGFVGVMIMIGLVCVVGPVQSAEGPEVGSTIHRVVMHLNSGEEKVQRGALNNIKNLYEAMGSERLNVELVAHGAGLSLFTKQDTKLAEELAKLKTTYGVSYTACSNTMKAQGLTRADLIEQVDRTMPAMVRLMELQEQGWAYIKP